MDSAVVAADAGLDLVDARALPIERRRHGSGFRYLLDGRSVGSSRRATIVALSIPPAWEEVCVADTDDAHIQASGVDADGRIQYLYHPRFRAAADRLKFARLGELGERLARVRQTVHAALDADRDGADLATHIAAIVELIDVTAIRVGSVRYAEEHGTIGASTLERRHVEVDSPTTHLAFVAKSGIDRDLSFENARLSRFLMQRTATLRRPDDRVFSGPEGGSLTGAAVGCALSTWSGMTMTAKELRTWSATSTMVAALLDPDGIEVHEAGPSETTSGSHDPVLRAYDIVAAHLGNTRAVARSSYVAPLVVEAFDDGRLEDAWRRSRTSAVHDRAEQTLRKLLADSAQTISPG